MTIGFLLFQVFRGVFLEQLYILIVIICLNILQQNILYRTFNFETAGNISWLKWFTYLNITQLKNYTKIWQPERACSSIAIHISRAGPHWLLPGNMPKSAGNFGIDDFYWLKRIWNRAPRYSKIDTKHGHKNPGSITVRKKKNMLIGVWNHI